MGSRSLCIFRNKGNMESPDSFSKSSSLCTPSPTLAGKDASLLSLRRSWGLVPFIGHGGSSGGSFLLMAFHCLSAVVPYWWSLHFFRGPFGDYSLISFIWRGSREQLPPTSNSWRICGLYHQFAIDHRLSCIIHFCLSALSFCPYPGRGMPCSAQGLPRGILLGSQGRLAKTCLPSILCAYYLDLSPLLWPCLGKACCPQQSRSTSSKKQRSAEASSLLPVVSSPWTAALGRQPSLI